jgi:hypothetical protein
VKENSGRTELNGVDKMKISQIMLLLEKEMKEADFSSKEKKEQSRISSKVKEENLKAPKSKKEDNKLSDKKKKQKDEDALDAFDKELDRQKKKKSSNDDNDNEIPDEEEYSDELDPDEIESEIEDEEAEKSEFHLEDAKSFSKFMDLVNNFRASSSLRDNPKVKEYFSKMTEGEKQAVCVFFSSLEKVANFEEDMDFKMPKTPKSWGINISSAKSSEEKKEIENIKKASSGNEKAEKEMSGTIPIKVGSTNEGRKFSIEQLLREVK